MSQVRPPSPSMWYDANGYQWGYLGPLGEQLDQNGDPLPEEKPSRMGYVLALLFVLILVTTIVLGAWWDGAFESGPPASIPITYGPPCGK